MDHSAQGSSAVGTPPISLSPAKIAVASQLMQGYRLATPFTAGSQIATAFNGNDKQTEVFSIGSDQHIYSIYFDADSDTGWSKADLNFPGKALYIAAGSYPDGSMVVYAVDSNHVIYANHGGQKWGSGWQALPKPDLGAWVGLGWEFMGIYGLRSWYFPDYIGTHPGPLLPHASAMSLLYDSNNNLLHWIPVYENVIGFDNTHNPDWFWTFGSDFVTTEATDWCPFTYSGPNSYPMPGCYFSGKVVLNGQVTTVLTANFGDGSRTAQAIVGTYSLLTTTRSLDGTGHTRDMLFAVSAQDSAVYQFSLNLNVNPVTLTPTKISDGTPVTSLAARTNPAGQMEVFALGADHYLYHVHQDSDNTTNSWSNFLRLNQDLKFSQIAAGQSPELNAEAFAITTDNRLFHVWQDMAGSEWHFDEVELAQDGQLEEIRTYTTQLTLFDDNEVAVANTPVKIFSDEPVWLDVNGVSTFIDSANPWSGQSNIVGQVTLTLPTESLGVLALAVWTSFMPSADRIELNLSAPVRDDLTNMTPDRLKNAQMTDDQGQQTPFLAPQFSDPDTVDAVLAALKSSLSLITDSPQPNAASSTSYFHRLNDARVTRYLANSAGEPLGRIDLSQVEEQHWQVSFTSGKPVYTELTREAADSLFAAKQALAETKSFWGSWGDIFDAIADGIAKINIQDFVVSFVKGAHDAINSAITFLYNGVTYIYNGTLSLIEQAFDLIETVFNAIGRFFSDIFKWLASIFPWQDILRSKKAIAYAFDQIVQFSETALIKATDVVVAGIDSFQTQIQDIFTTFIHDYLGQDPSNPSAPVTLDGFRAKHAPVLAGPSAEAERQVHATMRLNVLQNAWINSSNNVLAGNQSAPLMLDAATTTAIDDLMQQLSEWGQQFQSAQVFQDAQNYFSKIRDNPDQFLQLAASGLLSILEGLALLGLDIGKQIIRAISSAALAALKAISNFLTQSKWSIPIVSQLYQLITGDSLEFSPLDLVAIVIATPATIIYKAATKVAPFADDAALQAFEASFTATALLQWSGLAGNSPDTSASVMPAATSPLTADVRANFAKFFKVCSTVNSTCFLFVDVLLDAVPSVVAEAFLSKIAVVSGWVGALAGLPWWESDEPPICDNNYERFGNLLWLLQLFPIALDTIVVLRSGAILRTVPVFGAIVTSVLGCVNLILTIAWGVKMFTGGGDEWVDFCEGLFGAIPGCVKFLSLFEVAVWPLVVLLIVDVAGDALAVVFSVISTTLKLYPATDNPPVVLALGKPSGFIVNEGGELDIAKNC